MLLGQMLLGQMSLRPSTSIKVGPRKLTLNLVKIGSATAEIFLNWTNVTRTNVVWTNAPLTDVKSEWGLVY